MLRSTFLCAAMLSVAEALLPLSGYLRRPVQYNSASLEEVRKQNMRMQDTGLELETLVGPARLDKKNV